MNIAPELSIVIPLFNESENLPELHRRLSIALPSFVTAYELVFVDDGSADGTSDMLDACHASDPRVTVIHLSRNFGHQAAITAGIEHVRGSAVIVMDGDLQDPPEVLHEFVAAWRKGYEVVYAIRTKRKEHVVKRVGYFAFYRLLRMISELDIPLDSGDFCLMDRKVVDVLNTLPERMRFVRGLRTFVGFRQIGIPYERAARASGKPKYTLRALVRLAIDGLVNFSSYPLQLATYIGFLSVLISVAVGVWVLLDALYHRSTPRGWASTMVVVLFMGSIQLICLGIMGQYMRRVFIESKRRPSYIIRSVLLSPGGTDLSTGLRRPERDGGLGRQRTGWKE